MTQQEQAPQAQDQDTTTPGTPTPAEPTPATGTPDLRVIATSLDDVLDDIETSLEQNAQDYVSHFVQKGGQ